MKRRTPACGSEIAHGPHEYDKDYFPDGAVMSPRDPPAHCAGWTMTEADLCDMLRQVHVAMLEKAPVAGSGTFRLEVTTAVLAGLHGLHLPDDEAAWRIESVYGAELMIVIDPYAGHWRLAESTPVLQGRARI